MPAAYSSARRGLGRVILLGLEMLVDADIIRTVVLELTLLRVAVLAAVVAIRTFLSWSIEMEVEGRLPWHGRSSTSRTRRGATDSIASRLEIHPTP